MQIRSVRSVDSVIFFIKKIMFYNLMKTYSLRLLCVKNFKKENFNIFQIESVKTKKKEVFFPVCQQPVTTRCDINCPNDVIMELANVSNFKGNVLSLQQFWEFCIVISLLWISQAITWSLQDPICFNLLGKQYTSNYFNIIINLLNKNVILQL